MSEELKPCPFCGGTVLRTGGDDKVVGVACLRCQATGPNHYGSYEWNDRSDQTAYQDRVAAAHHALFHDDPTDIAERVARFFEEAVETCQAFGMSHYDADKLLTYTFGRPVGEPAKEIGAAALTLASLCVIAGYDMAACAESDLEKLQRPETIERIRAKRSTRHGRGPLPGLDPSATPQQKGK